MVFANTTPCRFDLVLAHTLLHMTRTLASTIKFVHQSSALCALVLWLLFFFPCIFLFSCCLLNKALSSLLICLLDALWCLDVNDTLAFGLRMMSFQHGGSLLSRPRNKSYLYIRLSLLGADMILKLKTSHGLAD